MYIVFSTDATIQAAGFEAWWDSIGPLDTATPTALPTTTPTPTGSPQISTLPPTRGAVCSGVVVLSDERGSLTDGSANQR